MINYQNVAAATLAEFATSLVSGAHEEEAKAQLTRRVAWKVHQQNPNIGLLRKPGGNNVHGLSVDVLIDRSDGSWADMASATSIWPGGNVQVTTPWTAHDSDLSAEWLERWVEPTEALANLPGPMQLVGSAPVPAPAPAPAPAPIQVQGQPRVTYDQFVKVEAAQVHQRYVDVHGHGPALSDMYHTAWRRLMEGWTHEDVLADIRK